MVCVGACTVGGMRSGTFKKFRDRGSEVLEAAWELGGRDRRLVVDSVVLRWGMTASAVGAEDPAMLAVKGCVLGEGGVPEAGFLVGWYRRRGWWQEPEGSAVRSVLVDWFVPGSGRSHCGSTEPRLDGFGWGSAVSFGLRHWVGGVPAGVPGSERCVESRMGSSEPLGSMLGVRGRVCVHPCSDIWGFEGKVWGFPYAAWEGLGGMCGEWWDGLLRTVLLCESPYGVSAGVDVLNAAARVGVCSMGWLDLFSSGYWVWLVSRSEVGAGLVADRLGVDPVLLRAVCEHEVAEQFRCGAVFPSVSVQRLVSLVC